MKRFVSIILIILLISVVYTNYSYAGIAEDLKMKGVSSAPADGGTKTKEVINIIIGIIQFVGTGISLIVISLLGIKYILASPSEKADVKKNILPIIIGCILLFAAVNIIGMVENFTSTAGLVGK